MNPDLLIPPRPTISNIQWISGTQYVTPADMDLLSKLTSATTCTETISFESTANTTSSRRPRPPTIKTHARPSPLRSRTSPALSRPCKPTTRLLVQLSISILPDQRCPSERRLERMGDAPIQRAHRGIESSERRHEQLVQ